MQKRNQAFFYIILLIVAFALYWYRGKENSELPAKPDTRQETKDPGKAVTPSQRKTGSAIDQLTSEAVVVAFVKENGRLPDYYITKQEARQQGWIASKGNLCDVLPGKAIGGDVFTNRQRALPVKAGRQWFEADLNYHCGRRNADRILFSNDHLIFVTKDHYSTFEEK